MIVWTTNFCSARFLVDYIAYLDEGEALYYGEKDYLRMDTSWGKMAYGPVIAHIDILLYRFGILQDLNKLMYLHQILHSIQIIIFYYIGAAIFKKRSDFVFFNFLVCLLFNERLLSVVLLANDAFL